MTRSGALWCMASLLVSCGSTGTVASTAKHDDSATVTDSTGPADTGTAYIDPDFNGDGALRILVLGTNQSLDRSTGFSPDQIAVELQHIFTADAAAPADVHVSAEDIHLRKAVTIGMGGGGDEYTYEHHSHSLLQYYYWPDEQSARMANLMGNGAFDWDHVVIGADPHIVATTPGWYALGAHKVASKVAEGGGQPLLLMVWPQDDPSGTALPHFEEFTYRTSDGAPVPLQTVPAGLGWASLPSEQQDSSPEHPSPNGAILAAATIYAQLTGQNASDSGDPLSDVAFETVQEQQGALHYEGDRSFSSPFAGCHITDDTISYNHTGSSSENGILDGLRWVFDQAPQTLQNGGDAPITFNYGRANTNFEPDKRYQVDPERFSFSFGFPMQDHANHGDVSMLYGLDHRNSGVTNDTDLGVAAFMIQQSELPYARAIPIRALFAQMKEVTPEQSAYRDNWHMHRDLDKAIAGYMYTLLTDDCALGEEPADPASEAWRTWTAHKIGCDTAWTFLHLDANRPF